MGGLLLLAFQIIKRNIGQGLGHSLNYQTNQENQVNGVSMLEMIVAITYLRYVLENQINLCNFNSSLNRCVQTLFHGANLAYIKPSKYTHKHHFQEWLVLHYKTKFQI